jgi:hypothetical protein
MSDGAFADYDGASIVAAGNVRLLANRALPGIVILASSAALGVWMLYLRPVQSPIAPLPQASVQRPAANPFGGLAVLNVEATLRQAPRADLLAPLGGTPDEMAFERAAPWGGMFPDNPYGRLADIRPSVSDNTLGIGPNLKLELESGLAATENQIASAPLPPRRPADLGAAPAPAATPSPAIASHDANPPAQNAPGFFEKLFAGLHPQQGQAVAYANPETTTISRSPSQNAILRSVTPSWSSAPGALSRYDKFTAVYDIEGRTVYLPDGRRLEAHSGLGALKDDPSRVAARARGATPPDVYELTPREGLFHGVQALRLNPVGSGDQFGRTGLLAHPYMLGPDGDSFGCVSFKDYDAFLNAFQSGQVKKLAVVAKLD